jgi:hypothetical protein
VLSVDHERVQQGALVIVLRTGQPKLSRLLRGSIQRTHRPRALLANRAGPT